MTTMTTLHDSMSRAGTLAVRASDIKLIRPGDDAGRAALRLLAHLMGARIQPGEVTLAGQSHPALLAISANGVALAAVLLDEQDALEGLPTCEP